MTRPPIPADMAAERRGVYRQATLAFLLWLPVLGAAVWWLPQSVEFPVETGERLAFAARAILLILLCLFIAVGIVSTLRRYAEPRDITGSAYGPPSERLVTTGIPITGAFVWVLYDMLAGLLGGTI